MLTDEYLVLEEEHLNGIHRIYRFDNGYGLSLINTAMAHSYPYAWEAAVLMDVDENGEGGYITYETELTNDVEIFMSDDETNEFIWRAVWILSALDPPTQEDRERHKRREQELFDGLDLEAEQDTRQDETKTLRVKATGTAAVEVSKNIGEFLKGLG